MVGFKGKSESYLYLNDAAKDILFPNKTAHPISLEVSQKHISGSILTTAYSGFYIGSTRLYNQSRGYTGDLEYNDTFTTSAVTGCNKDTSLACSGYTGNNSYSCFTRWINLTFYFTRYDFSASAGANVTSASVSSSTGYDGDTIQYRCMLDSGAEWQGWYKDGALYSATKDLDVTVNGSDLALEARATMPVTTKTLSATYNGAQLQGFPMSVQADAPITYGGVSKGTVPFSGAAKTLTCANKICRGNIGIGSKTLQCAGKMMATDVVCQIT